MADLSTLEIVDLPDFQSQIDAAISEAKRYFDFIKQGNAELKTANTVGGITAAANTANTGVNGASTATNAANDALKANTDQQKANNDAANNGAKATRQLTLERAKQNEAIKELNKNMRDAAREALGLTSEYDKLNKQFLVLQKTAKDLQAKAILDPKFKTEADEASAKANNLNASLKAIDATVGNYQRSVGNYNVAAQTIIDILDRENLKLQELEATRVRVQQSGAVPFSPTQTAGGVTSFKQVGSLSATTNAAQLQSLDAQITQSRTIVEGFNRLTKDPEFLNISSKTASAAQGVKVLNSALTQLKNQGLGGTDAAKSLGNFINESDVSRTRNYTSALSILQDQYGKVNAAIDQNIAANRGDSAENKELIQEQSLLKTFLNQQQAGYLSLSRELMATVKQKQALADANLQDTETYRELDALTIQYTRSLREQRNDQALLSSEAPKLQALTYAVKGLAGSYAIGTGAVALFGDESGKLSEKLNQLVAVQTILQGLTEINEFLTRKSAISTALFGEEVTLAIDEQKAHTGAIVENTAAQEEQIAVQDTATVSTVAGTAAVEAEGVAMTETAVATKGFAAALEFLEANPIILVLGALAAVLLLVFENLDNTHDELIKNIEAETSWANAINETTDALKEQIGLTNESTDAVKANLQTKLDVAEKEGYSAEKLFALKKSILDQEGKELALANKSAKEQNIDQTDVLKNLTENQGKKIALEQQVADLSAAKKSGDRYVADDGTTFKDEGGTDASGHIYGADEVESIDDKIKEAQDDIKVYDAAVKSLSKTHQDAVDLQKRNDAYDKDIQLQKATIEKFNADERRKQILANAQLEYETTKETNDKILSDTKSSLDERLTAIKSNGDAEIALRTAQNREVQNDVGKTKNDRAISQNNLNSFINTTNDKTTDSSNDAIEQESEKYLALQQQINAAILQADSVLQENLYNDQSKSFADRTTALGNYNADQATLILNAGNAELEAKGLFAQQGAALDEANQAEKLRIETETAEKLKELALKTAKEQHEIIIESNNQLTSDIDRVIKTNLVNKEGADFKNSKNNKFYDLQKKIDEDNARNDELQNQLEGAQNQANDYSSTATDASRKEGADKVTDISNQITANNTQTDYDKRAKEAAQEKALAEEIKDDALKGLDVIEKAENSMFDARKKRLEEDVRLTQEAEADKVGAIKNSTINSVEGALAIRKAEKEAALRKKNDEREERAIEVEKAKFDKAVAIAKIILNTAVAITKAAPNEIQMAVAAAAGALELGAAAAVQIPSYAAGTDNHPGGVMRVGEAGPERVTEPSGRSYLVDGETFTYAPPGTEVKPLYHSEAAEYQKNMYAKNVTLSSIRKNEFALADRMVTGMGNHFRSLERKVGKIQGAKINIAADIRNSDYIKLVVKGVQKR